MPTIKDVANQAGVSVATASRALRNIGYLSQKTIDKVKLASKELGYFVDLNAQQLKMGVSNSVGVIVSDMNNHFYNFILAKLETNVKKRFNIVLITSSFERADEERKSFKALLSAKVAAIIFTPVCNTNHDLIAIAKRNNIKVIQLYRKVYPDIDSITIDDELGAYLATQHLLEKHCKRPLLIDVKYAHLENNQVFPSRANGYLNAIRETTISPLIFYHSITDENVPQLKEFILANQPDGIICGTNNFGMEVLNIYKELATPQSVNLVVFDDLDWATYLNITSIKQSISRVVDRLIQIIYDSDVTPTDEKVPPILIERNTQITLGGNR